MADDTNYIKGYSSYDVIHWKVGKIGRQFMAGAIKTSRGQGEEKPFLC